MPRARDLGIEIGELAPGRYDAITDVDGVRVGHATLSTRGKRWPTRAAARWKKETSAAAPG
jgi:L-aminopeptidase/D-esterase-like protein